MKELISHFGWTYDVFHHDVYDYTYISINKLYMDSYDFPADVEELWEYTRFR
jgi:hypothetical protein